jgi:hypothetical protein
MGLPVYAATRDCTVKSAPDVGVGVHLILSGPQLGAIASRWPAGAVIEQTWTEKGGTHTYVKADGGAYHVSADGSISEKLGDPR